MDIFWEALISSLIVLGTLLMLVGSIGLAKFPDFYTRLHAPTKASTLGVGLVLIGSAIFFSLQQGYPSFKELLVTMFLMITAPIAAHMLAKTGLHYQVKLQANTQNPDLVDKAYKHQGPN